MYLNWAIEEFEVNIVITYHNQRHFGSNVKSAHLTSR